MSVVSLNLSGEKKIVGLQEASDSLTTRITHGEFQVSASRNTASAVATMESLDSVQQANTVASLESLARTLKSEFGDMMGGDLTNAQITAGSIAFGAAGNPQTYHSQAMRSKAVSTDTVRTVSAESAGFDYGYTGEIHPAMEAFDNGNLQVFAGMSVLYNMQAARQDAFGEGFFRTVVLTPDNGGADIAIRSQLVLNHFLHQSTGDPADFKQKRLLEAAIDYKILSDQSTALVPEVFAGNTQYFVPAAVVAPRTLDLGSRVVTTAPLLVDKRVDLIGVAQNTLMQKNGQPDNMSSLDRMIGLKALYLQIAGTDVADTNGDVIKFDVVNMPRSFFIKPNEGRSTQQLLHFRNNSLQLNAKTKQIDGIAPTNATLAQIISGNYTVRLSITVTGEVDVETGNALVQASPVQVSAVYNAAGERLDLTTGEGLSIVTGLADLKIIGWDPNARLSNADRRERGLLMNTQEYVERYPVLLAAPMSIPSPLTENRDGSDINTLITATRMRNSNNAVTKLLEVTDNLMQWNMVTEESISEDVLPEIEGIARFLIRPWFKDDEIDLRTVTVSLKSHERVLDINAALVNRLRDHVYTAVIESNYQTALDAITGYTGEKPKVVIGTDPKISRFVIVQGDSRTLGDDIEFKKVTTMDSRVRGYIYWTFVREGEGLDPLNFGSFLWIPELISHVQVARGGAQVREAMVQNRCRHVVHLPILGRLKVTGLDEVLSDGWVIPTAV